MADENLVTVTNNENPPINLEIVAYKNIVDVNFLQSIESVITAHNTSKDAHAGLKAEITTDVNTILATKANVLTTYTKNETDTMLAAKINTSDTAVTKQGNTFNGANQLIKLDSSGKIPQVDGSALINLSQGQINGLSTALNGKEPLHSKYDSGWFAVTVNTIYTKTHGLGTSNIKYIVLVADDSNGTNQRPAQDQFTVGSSYIGFVPAGTTSMTLSVKTCIHYVGSDTNNSYIITSFYRIIAETL